METSYRNFILDELAVRQARNSSYSQNALAKQIGISPPKLAQILNGRSGLSPERAFEVATGLGLAAEEVELFVTMVEVEHARSPQVRNRAANRLQLFAQDDKVWGRLTTSKVLQSWWHLAVLNLLDVECAVSVSEIAVQLELPKETLRQSLDLLVEAELARKNSGRVFGKQRKNHF